jgi:tartrate dehydratase alpha subunit/fumarate hydratase class I-like protein
MNRVIDIFFCGGLIIGIVVGTGVIHAKKEKVKSLSRHLQVRAKAKVLSVRKVVLTS